MEIGKTRNCLPFGRRVSTQFLVFPISTLVDITVYQHGKCFIFINSTFTFFCHLFWLFQGKIAAGLGSMIAINTKQNNTILINNKSIYNLQYKGALYKPDYTQKRNFGMGACFAWGGG